jgi:glucokinase
VLLLTLGTGVGGGVLLNGQLFSGHGGAAAEPGLISVDPEGPPCNSGNRGSLEQHCSISGLRRLMDVEPQKLDQLARIGDPEARAAWRDYGRWLGVGLSSLIYVLTPQLVLIGGGLSAATDHFLPSALAEVEQRVQAESRQGLEIRRAQLGNGAGRLGAARLALERLRV